MKLCRIKSESHHQSNCIWDDFVLCDTSKFVILMIINNKIRVDYEREFVI